MVVRQGRREVLVAIGGPGPGLLFRLFAGFVAGLGIGIGPRSERPVSFAISSSSE